MTVKLKITTKCTLKMLKLGMLSSFHPHAMCKMVEMVTAKTEQTSCTNWSISFGVSGFRTRTHPLHGHFIFLNFLELRNFFVFLHTIQSDVINFQHCRGELILEHLWGRRTGPFSVRRGVEIARRADRGEAHEQFTQLRSSPER